jgi:hypothetical protein
MAERVEQRFGYALILVFARGLDMGVAVVVAVTD